MILSIKIDNIFADEINRIAFFILNSIILNFIFSLFLFPEVSFLLSTLISTLLIDYLRVGKKSFYTILADTKGLSKNIYFSFGLFLISLFVFIMAIKLFGIEIELSISKPIYYFNILIIILISSIAEELTFRGIIFSAFRDKYGDSLAVLITSLLFSSGHFLNSNFNLFAFINTFLAGILFALIVIKTNQLISSIIFHFLWNFMLVFLLNSPLSGFNLDISLLNIIYPKTSLIFGDFYGLESGFLTTFILIFFIDLSSRIFKESPFITSKLFYRRYNESKLKG